MMALLKILGGLLGDVLGAVKRDPWPFVVGVLVVALIWQRGQWRSAVADAAAWKSGFEQQRDEMVKFKADVKAQRDQAAKLDQQNVARVQREADLKLKDVTDDFKTALARARRAVDLRMQRPAAPARGEGGAGGRGEAILSGLPALSEGALLPGDAAIISRSDALICSDNTIRLEHVIKAWEGVAQVDVNGGGND